MTDAFSAIAGKELSDGLRNRWVWMVSLALAVAVLAIALFGSAPVGVTGVQEVGALLASVMNLIVYLVPLLALVLGCGAIIDEKQRGTLDIILLSAVSPSAYVCGTFAGFAAALSIAITAGLGAASVALVGRYDVAPFECIVLIVFAILLGAAFLALAFLLSLLARERGRAIVCSVFVWLAAVFVFDLILVGVLVASKGGVPQWLFAALLLMNPADLFRMGCFQWLGGTATALGLSMWETYAPSVPTVAVAAVAWIGGPIAATYALFRRRVRADSLA
jgi:Cu-processing system permease protein